MIPDRFALFLDDERFPVSADYDTLTPWVIARSLAEVQDLVMSKGLFVHASFDHDLGSGPSGMDVAHWLIDFILDHGLIPQFTFDVHSMNPVGAANIRGLLRNFLERAGSSPPT